MKTNNKDLFVYKVTYTKAIGGEGSILVKANDADTALIRAERHCFTGKEFRNAILTNEEYVSPYKQGFTHTLTGV